MSDPQVATTHKGRQVRRSQSLFVPTLHRNVPCASYDDHFIFYTPEPNQSAFMCTCGSPAVIANLDSDKLMFVCLCHATYGRHVTGGDRWI